MYVCLFQCPTMHCMHSYGNNIIPKDRLCQIMGESQLQTSEVDSESMLTANNCRETV